MSHPTNAVLRSQAQSGLDQSDATLRDMIAADPDYALALVDRLRAAEAGGPFYPADVEERALLFSLAGHSLLKGLLAAADQLTATAGEEERDDPA